MWSGVTSWISNLLSDPVGFSSVVLTAALVGLYYRQANIQKTQRDLIEDQAQTQEEQRTIMGRQADVQEGQRELMEVEQEPTVLVDGFRGGTEERGGIESLEIKVSNLGRNAATDLELKVASGFHEETPFRGGVETEPLEEADFEEGMTREERDEDTRDWQQDYGDYLEPQERGAEFVAYDLPVRWSHEEEQYGGPLYLSHLRQELSDYMELDSVRLKVWIQYKDHKEEVQEVDVFDYILPLCDESGEKVWSVDLMLVNSEHPNESYPLNMSSDL